MPADPHWADHYMIQLQEFLHSGFDTEPVIFL